MVFDAAGTLIHVKPSVSQAYSTVAASLGIHEPADSIQHRVGPAWKKWFSIDELPTNEADQLSRWQGLVRDCFPDLHDDQFSQLFSALWNHFTLPEAWEIDEDAEHVLSWFAAHHWKIAIASNFDQRLPKLLEQYKAFRCVDHVFYSSQVGWSKPNPHFYRSIQEKLGVEPQDILMVGDTWSNDYQAPKAVGWQAIWLNPNRTPVEWSIGTQPTDPSDHEDHQTIHRLADLISLSMF